MKKFMKIINLKLREILKKVLKVKTVKRKKQKLTTKVSKTMQ